MQRRWPHLLLTASVLAWARITTAGAAAAESGAVGNASVSIWPGDPPGTAAAAAPEQVRLTELGEHIITSVHHPSLTPYLPDPALATGAAVIVIPGGGHSELWMDHEGYWVGQWLSAHGIAAFVLKYRLARQRGSTYTVEGDELADVQRAIRFVRNRATAWHIDAGRVGVLGFSAGGELALLAGTRPARALNTGSDSAKGGDEVERQSASPAFVGLMYPGIPESMPLPKRLPPMFLLCGAQDSPALVARLPQLYRDIVAAGGAAELHILANANHGFGLRDANPPAVAIWPTLFYNWLAASGFLKGS